MLFMMRKSNSALVSITLKIAPSNHTLLKMLRKALLCRNALGMYNKQVNKMREVDEIEDDLRSKYVEVCRQV
jgi:hypothetical protein